MSYYEWIFKNTKNIHFLRLMFLILEIALIIISISFIMFIFKYNKKVNKLEKEIKEVKMDYQFLKYNTEQLEEYNGK